MPPLKVEVRLQGSGRIVDDRAKKYVLNSVKPGVNMEIKEEAKCQVTEKSYEAVGDREEREGKGGRGRREIWNSESRDQRKKERQT